VSLAVPLPAFAAERPEHDPCCPRSRADRATGEPWGPRGLARLRNVADRSRACVTPARGTAQGAARLLVAGDCEGLVWLVRYPLPT
jgi:hypothetical protein